MTPGAVRPPGEPPDAAAPREERPCPTAAASSPRPPASLRPRPPAPTTAGPGPRTRSSPSTAVIRGVRLGNPHGELDVEAADGLWIAEIGQPYRNERAGLTEALLALDTEVTLEGHRSRDPDQKVMKAERVIIAGKLYDLYPERS